MADWVTDYDFGISAIDSGFDRPAFDAIHLVVEKGRAALIDTAVNAAVPRVLAALEQKGLRPEQVDYVMLTHIHLDHAGGAGALMRALPNARLTVHPRGARHMIDPARLWEGTVAVYGEEVARRNYGEIVPVPPERVIETPEGASVELGGRRFEFLDTPGHARHHVCILDTASGRLFAGDTFGSSYPELARDGRRFVFPITTPVQFDPEALHRSVDRILALRPEAIYVTHYSEIRDLERLGSDLHRLIDAHAELGRRERDAGEQRLERLKTGVRDIVLAEARRQGWTLERHRLLEVFSIDIELNGAGIASWLDAGG